MESECCSWLVGLCFVIVIAVAPPVAAVAQNLPPSPLWPDIPMVSCPALAPPSDQSQQTWKHGQLERDSFNASVALFQAKNYTEAADGFAKFAGEYPDSDYKEAAISSELVAESYAKNKPGVINAAAKIIRLPAASALSREVAFVTLCDSLSPYVRPDDPAEGRKLADLEKWTRCGEEALTTRLSGTSATPQAVSEKTRKISESVLERTAGFVAYMRQDYVQANVKL